MVCLNAIRSHGTIKISAFQKFWRSSVHRRHAFLICIPFRRIAAAIFIHRAIHLCDATTDEGHNELRVDDLITAGISTECILTT